MRLTPLLLAGCLQVHGESNIPMDKRTTCVLQMDRLEQSCKDANVIGENDNTELKAAIKEVKECLDMELGIVCSDPGFGEPHILSYKAE